MNYGWETNGVQSAFRRRDATQRAPRVVNRGFKPTATLGSSLRDATAVRGSTARGKQYSNTFKWPLYPTGVDQTELDAALAPGPATPASFPSFRIDKFSD